MTVRLLNPNERFEAGRISMICFHDRLEGDVEEKRKACEAETCEDYGAFTDDGTLMAHIINNKFTANFDGHTVAMGGIGAVSTLPEYRNTGAVKNIFKELLPKAYGEGEVLSSLYPFSHEFYRKFGYDTVCMANVYELAPNALKNYHFDGEAVMYTPNAPVSEYTSLYNKFASVYNFAAVRDDEMMKEHMGGEYFRNRRFEYLLKLEGRAVAYIIFSDKKEDCGFVIDMEDMAYDGAAGFNAILGFLKRFSADYALIRIRLPLDTDLNRIIRTPDAYGIKNRTSFGFMCRLINVQKALELMKKPENCDVLIEVDDPYIKENCGIWHVTSKGAAAGTGNLPKLKTSIPTLSQLVCGAITYKEAMLKEDTEIATEGCAYGTEDYAKAERAFAELFTGKPCFIAENF